MIKISEFVETDRERAIAIVRCELERRLTVQPQQARLDEADEADEIDEDSPPPAQRGRPRSAKIAPKSAKRKGVPPSATAPAAELEVAPVPTEAVTVRRARQALEKFTRDPLNCAYTFSNYTVESRRGTNRTYTLDKVRLSHLVNTQRVVMFGANKYCSSTSTDWVILKSDLDDLSHIRACLLTRYNPSALKGSLIVLYNLNIEGTTFALDVGQHPSVRKIVGVAGEETHCALVSDDSGSIYLTTADNAGLPEEVLPPIVEEDLFRAWGVKYSERIQERVKGCEKKIARLNSALLEQSAEVGAQRVTLALIRDGGSKVVSEQIAKIRALAAVADVSIREDGLLVRTVPLVSDDVTGARGRYMGVFEISISMLYPKIEYRNVAPPKARQAHPHGSCMEGFIPYMTSAYARFNYEAVAATVLEFLRGVTPEDSHSMRSYRDHWPATVNPPLTLKAPSDWVILLRSRPDDTDDEEEDD